MHDLLVEAKAAAEELARNLGILDELVQDGSSPQLALDALSKVKASYSRLRQAKRVMPTRPQLAAQMENYDR